MSLQIIVVSCLVLIALLLILIQFSFSNKSKNKAEDKNMADENTYEMELTCQNCRSCDTYEIPVKRKVVDFAKTLQCENCELVGMLIDDNSLVNQDSEGAE